MKQQKIRIGILSLGCPKTLVDSEIVLGRLKDPRYVLAHTAEESDAVLLNTCGFIRDAKQESINAILKLAELKRSGMIRVLIVMGCLVQLYAKELGKNFKEVDAFLGSGDYDRIAEVLRSVFRGGKRTVVKRAGYLGLAGENRVSLTPRYYRYLKISEGCDHTCSFCVIPRIRGKFRSRRIHDVVREAKRLAREGAKELLLVGQDTSNFGYDYAQKHLLPSLLRQLEAVAGIRWIRLLYAYPSSVTGELIRTLALSRKICRYIDLPLQHINDRILRSMRRGTTKQRTVEMIRRLRAAVPGLVIRTSFIVGYPGETEAEFRELLEFMRAMKFERAGIFKYSAEAGSPAAKLPRQVPERIKEKRYHAAMRLQREVARGLNRRWIGKKLEVLVEGRDEKNAGYWRGRSYMDAPEIDGAVLIRTPQKLKAGYFYPVTITDAKDYDLIGRT